jgi:predicted DNA-binding protein with PD1-like motif
MQFSEAKQGRVFVVRLEDGEIVHNEIEKLARKKAIHAAAVLIIGGADKDSSLVVGPEQGRGVSPVIPMTYALGDVHEVAGTGTIFPDENGQPVLHLHMACGRDNQTITGCIRPGVKVWHVMEAIIFEIVATGAARRMDPKTGFKLLSL